MTYDRWSELADFLQQSSREQEKAVCVRDMQGFPNKHQSFSGAWSYYDDGWKWCACADCKAYEKDYQAQSGKFSKARV